MKKYEDKNQDLIAQNMWDKAYHDVNKDWDEPSQKQYLLKNAKDIKFDDEFKC